MNLILHKTLPLLVMPLSISLILLVYSTFISTGQFRQRIVIFLAVSILTIFSLPVVSKGLIASLESRYPSLSIEETPVADAIIVLGGGVSPPYHPRAQSELSVGGDRILLTTRLWKAGKAPTIIVTGDALDNNDQIKSEAEHTLEILNLFGVQKDKVILEKESKNTEQHVTYLKPIIEQKNIKSILLVTSAMHMPRAMEYFSQLALTVHAVPANRWITTNSSISNSWIPAAVSLYGSSSALREYLGILYRNFRHNISFL